MTDLRSQETLQPVAFVVLLFVVVLSISRLIPPFQSPDEFNHVKRAYLLSKGHIFLHVTEGETGGDIDAGLLEYMDIFQRLPVHYQEKVTQRMLREARKISWTHQSRFSPLPNTAVYFPLSYLPQATAFVFGRLAELTVNDTYYLARMLSLLATITTLWIAARLYPVPLLVYGLLATPMTIFQMGSASLDALSFAMCVLSAALYMRAAAKTTRFTGTMHAALIVCLLLLATSRTNLIGTIWLPFVLHPIRRRRLYLITTVILIGICVWWILFAAATVKGVGIQIQPVSPAEILSYYLVHIGEFLSVMYSTFTSGTLLLSYWRMFVGVWGWRDTPLDWAIYWAFAIALGALAAISISTNMKELLSPTRMCLVVAAILSTLLLFLIFLLTFTLHPANFIGAIQGRYFYPMAILLAFALFDQPMSQSRTRIASALVLLMLTLSATTMATTLIGRYWAL